VFASSYGTNACIGTLSFLTLCAFCRWITAWLCGHSSLRGTVYPFSVPWSSWSGGVATFLPHTTMVAIFPLKLPCHCTSELLIFRGHVVHGNHHRRKVCLLTWWMHRMPWVFTYNDWSAGTEYDYMVKAAVSSAVNVARMRAFCMFSGSTDSPMYKWFISKGVAIIQVGCGSLLLRFLRAWVSRIRTFLQVWCAAHTCVERCLSQRGSSQSRIQCQGVLPCLLLASLLPFLAAAEHCRGFKHLHSLTSDPLSADAVTPVQK
jgi:hypothetical protein